MNAFGLLLLAVGCFVIWIAWHNTYGPVGAALGMRANMGSSSLPSGA
jgi:hypothetical protein